MPLTGQLLADRIRSTPSYGADDADCLFEIERRNHYTKSGSDPAEHLSERYFMTAGILVARTSRVMLSFRLVFGSCGRFYGYVQICPSP